MGFLSMKYKHKTLMVTGLFLYNLSAVTCSLAPNFSILVAVYALSGLGFALVTPMVTTLIGELLPVENRTSVLGYTVGGQALLYVSGSLLATYIAIRAGWRWAFMGLVFPISALSLLLVVKAIPSAKTKMTPRSIGDFITGFKAISSNRSAVACVVGTALAVSAWNFYLVFGPSFWRQRYLVSTVFVSISMVFTALSYILGSLLSGRVVRRFGRKPLVVYSVCILGLLTLAVTNLPTFWMSLVVSMVASLCAGMMITGYSSLTLEQVPMFRGTMMSLSSAATSLGQLICASFGGFLLLQYGYGILGVGLGLVGMVSAYVFHSFALDTIRVGQE
jgi:predicted MFS family arabinose efflux permease